MHRQAFWIAVTDLHESAQKLEAVPDADKASGIIVTGDLTNVGDGNRAKRILDRIAAVNPAIYAVAGNMDKPEVRDLLQEKDVSIQARGVALNESVGLAGVGCSLPTPFATPSEVPEETLDAWLQQGFSQISHMPRILLATHNPPLNTITDRLANGRHVGSRKLREFIETHQPDVVLTGHIHEAVGEDRIGDTRIINPGPLQSGGYVLIRQDPDGGLQARLCSLAP